MSCQRMDFDSVNFEWMREMAQEAGANIDKTEEKG